MSDAFADDQYQEAQGLQMKYNDTFNDFSQLQSQSMLEQKFQSLSPVSVIR